MQSKKRILPEVAFGIAIVRGIAAIGVGLFLVFAPDKSAPILVNMMGFFWLLTGIALLRRSRDDSVVRGVGRRATRVIAIVGVLAGLFVVTRNLTRQVAPEAAYFALLGVVILLTGLVHLTANVRAGGAIRQRHRWLSILLGIFEISLGLLLMISPLDRSPVTYWIVTIWALVFGVLVIGDALAKRSQARKAIGSAHSERGASVEAATKSDSE